jgi:hypothetical protein
MSDEHLAVAIREAFDEKYLPSPGLADRVISAIPWDRQPARAASVPRLAGAFTAILTLLILAVLIGPFVLTMGSRLGQASPSPAPQSSIVNTDPRCKGIRLLPDRVFQRIAVYRWRSSGSAFVAVPTGLDGSMAADAIFNPSPNQPDDRSVIVFFNARGQALLDQLTTEIAIYQSAGPISDTPVHHLAVLVGLTDQQVANWADPVVAEKALMPIEQGGNLLSNGVVLTPFTGNQLIVYFGPDLPTACSLTAHPK